jgi:hypothetical protein
MLWYLRRIFRCSATCDHHRAVRMSPPWWTPGLRLVPVDETCNNTGGGNRCPGCPSDDHVPKQSCPFGGSPQGRDGRSCCRLWLLANGIGLLFALDRFFKMKRRKFDRALPMVSAVEQRGGMDHGRHEEEEAGFFCRGDPFRILLHEFATRASERHRLY